jgi:hypothetical protein
MVTGPHPARQVKGNAQESRRNTCAVPPRKRMEARCLEKSETLKMPAASASA